MTYPPTVYIRQEDTYDALADWHRTPRWRVLRRRSLWRRVEILTDELARLIGAGGEHR